MPFVNKIANLRSLAIVGMAKNTGKTESLNYILRRLKEDYPKLSLALTSIGIDGEKRDQVTQTDKPEICLAENNVFITAEKFYRLKRLPAEVFDVEESYTTSIGKLVYARAKGEGKALIAGPPSTGGLQHVLGKMEASGIDLTIIDGALSRLSLASPTVAEGMVLATGAACSAQPDNLIKRTVDLHRLICLPELEDRALARKLQDIDLGLRVIDDENNLYDPGFASALLPQMWEKTDWLTRGSQLYVAGVVNDRLLDQLRLIKGHECVIVKDFTRIFASSRSVRNYLHAGKRLVTLYQATLVAVTFNPLAPSGYRLDSCKMCSRLEEELGIPVYDVKQQ